MCYIKTKVIKIDQPLGSFYVASIPAEKLLNIAYSHPAELLKDGYQISGTQRWEDSKRLKEISEYIGTHEASFPNSIILGANYDRDGNYVIDETSWSIEEENGSLFLVVPQEIKLASIIDGQHRLNAFRYCEPGLRKFELLCAIYIDLPLPFHAYIFSTINFNQKKVDRSLAYNLFGFDIESSDPKTWVPETLAVSLARRLNLLDGPFKRKISLGLVESEENSAAFKLVSMATIVDGILKLISKNPKRDRTKLTSVNLKKRDRSALDDDGSPLRFMYLSQYDDAILEVIRNYFFVVNEIFWDIEDPDPYIKKTVGIQALFDVLLKLLGDFQNRLDGEYEDFKSQLEPLKGMKFADAQASGIGRTNIKNAILDKLELR